MSHTAPWMDPSQMPDSTYQQQQREWPHSSPVSFNPHAFQLYQDPNSGHLAQNLPGAVTQALWAGSVPSSGATVDYSEHPEAIVEHAHPGADGEVAVEGTLHECDEVPCPSRTEGKKGSRKRGRDWTDEETSVLVECKRSCFVDRGSRYSKHKSNATNWDAIAEAVRDSNPDSCGALERTGDQCRLRWDTLVKSHRLIKERCLESGKKYAEVMADDTRSLKLATTLMPKWYEVIDSVSGKARSRKQSNPGACKSKNGGEGDGPVSAGMGRTEAGPHALLLEGVPGSIPAAPGCPGMSKPKRQAVQRFQSLGPRLRSTLLDLILWAEHYPFTFCYYEYDSLSRTCEWLSVVQTRSRSDVYHDVSMLMQMRLVHVREYYHDFGEEMVGFVKIKLSCFRVLEKFVKKLIERNPDLDTQKLLESPNLKTFLPGRELVTPHRIRVLILFQCYKLESVDLRGLRKLRLLAISLCPVLKEITGWKYLRELGWLEMRMCRAGAAYSNLQDLPSLRVCILRRNSGDPAGHKFDITQCVRLRRLEIIGDEDLKESGDLSSLRCLEELTFNGCTALSTIDGLSGLHSLTRLELSHCEALRSLPDIGHMKELVHINITCTNVEEIPGIEKLVSLKTLRCAYSKLKHLPDLHHLPELQRIFLVGTPLIEDNPSSFYFDKEEVSFSREKESVLIEVSDIGDDEDVFSESPDDEDGYFG